MSQKQIVVAEEDVSVISTSPRHIHVTVRVGGSFLHLASVHVPQQNRDPLERQAVLTIIATFAQAAADHVCIVGVDANARLPAYFQDVTGGCIFAEHDDAGVDLAQLLHAHGLWVPTTFEAVHSGDTATWVHPGGKRSQIDYFLANNHLQHTAWATRVNAQFDLLNPRDDHSVLEARVTCILPGCTEGRRKLKRNMGLDLRALDQPEVRARLEAAFDSRCLESIPWDTDVNLHAQALAVGVQEALAQVLPRKEDTPKSSYVPEDAWQVRCKKMAFKKHTADRKQDFRKSALELVWRVLSAGPNEGADLCSRLQKLVVLYETAAGAVQIATAFIRRRIKERKNEILSSLSRSMGGLRPDHIMSRIKSQHLGRRRQAPWQRHLPSVRDHAGAVATGRESLDALWLQYFGDMEMGTVKGTTAFFQEAAQHQHAFDGFEPDVSALPTLDEIERAFRATQKNKATGLDLVPGDVLRKLPGRMAAAYFPLMLKSAVNLRQCIQWRGGVLAECYKQSGSPST